ncbi:signal peptidase II [Rubripirellula sp.]|nr:signal peptidase II [Rubripirellula sp.]
MDGSKTTTEASTKGGDSSTLGATEQTDSTNLSVPTENPTDKSVVPRSRPLLFFSLAILGGIADLWSKSFIFSWRGLPGDKDIWWIVDGYFGIETAVNIGAVFGLGAGKGTIFAAFSIIAAIGICVWLFWFKAAVSLWLTTALGLVTGGIIGNLYDRLGLWWVDEPGYFLEWQSGVRDWILIQIPGVPFLDPWPNFNIADSLLVVGAGMLLYQSFFPGNLADSGENVTPSHGKNESEPKSKKA